MGTFQFKLPDIGEGIAEAEIVAWHVKVGDIVSEDQQLADMMTDKATVEMESPVAGKVTKLAGEVGDQIPIGSVLVEIETEGDASAETAPAPAHEDVPLADGAAEPTPEQAEEIPTTAVAESKVAPAPEPVRVQPVAAATSAEQAEQDELAQALAELEAGERELKVKR